MSDPIDTPEVLGLRGPEGKASTELLTARDAAVAAAVRAATIQSVFAPFTELAAVLGCTAQVQQMVENVAANGANGDHRVYQSMPFTSGVAYQVRFVAKGGGRNVLVYANGGAPSFNAHFDLTAGTATGFSGTTATIKPIGNGYFECVATITATATGAGNLFLYLLQGDSLSYPGDGASGAIVIGVSVVDASAPAVELISSPYLSDASWTKDGVSVVSKVVSNPSIAAQVAALMAGGGVSKPYAGITCITLGTSFTAQATWQDMLAAATGMTVINHGQSGKTIGKNGADGTAMIYDSAQYVPQTTDIIIVLVEGPTNDFTLNTPLGDIGDRTTATLYGAYWAIAAAIYARAPNARVLFIGDYSGGSTGNGVGHNPTAVNGLGLQYVQYQQAPEDMARVVGVPFLPLWEYVANFFTADALTNDGLHPAAGKPIPGRIVKNIVRKLAEAAASGWLDA